VLTVLRWRLLPVAAAVVFGMVPSLACAARLADAPAPTSGAAATVAPGWRIVRFLPSATVDGLAVTGARDAWLAGDICGADSLCDHAYVRHWDGIAWRTVTVPKVVSVAYSEYGISAVAASSPSNAWVFDQRGHTDVGYTTVLHWTGQRWARPAHLAAAIQAAVAPSATDAWAFGAPASGDPLAGYIAHFNGKSWRQASFGVQVDSASALSAGDIWVGGSASGTTTAAVVIEHWNGKAWRKTPVPRLGIPPNDWTFVSVTAVTRRDVWASVNANATRSYQLHWNGRAWARTAFPCPGSSISVAPDGRRGLWLAAGPFIVGTGSEWFCHDAKGRWTKTAVPKRAGQQPGIDELAWIPGTRSLWATGGFNADAGEAIFKYGP
jgi:hypothetical protein